MSDVHGPTSIVQGPITTAARRRAVGRRSERKSFGSTAVWLFGRLEEPCGRRQARARWVADQTGPRDSKARPGMRAIFVGAWRARELRSGRDASCGDLTLLDPYQLHSRPWNSGAPARVAHHPKCRRPLRYIVRFPPGHPLRFCRRIPSNHSFQQG